MPGGYNSIKLSFATLKFFSVPVVFFIIIVSSVTTTYANRTNLSLAEAKYKASKEGKMIYVSFTASWCLPCQMMKAGAYKDQSVNYLLSKGMIPVLVEEENFQNIDWFNKYNVKTLPTTLVLDKNGNVIEQIEGFKSIKSIQDLLQLYSTALLDNADLSNIPIVFKTNVISSTRKPVPVATTKYNTSKLSASAEPIDENYRTITLNSKVTSNEKTKSISGKNSNVTKLYPTIYGIQLNSFNSIYDATEYQEYVNRHFGKEAIILTSDYEKVFKIIISCASLKDAKEQIVDFKESEISCFIRVI